MYRTLCCLAGFLACSAFPGCTSDPVSDYRRFLAGDFQRVASAHPDVTVDDQYKLDVEKTESLVSPLVGTCIVNVISGVVPSTADGISKKYSWSVEMKHALQDNKWVVTAVRGTLIGVELFYDATVDQSDPLLKSVTELYMKENEGKTYEFASLDIFCDAPVDPNCYVPDPVATFRKLCSEGMARAKAAGWQIKDVTIDVKKVESAVSCLVGDLVFAGTRPRIDEGGSYWNVGLEYAFQDERWVRKVARVGHKHPNARSVVWSDAGSIDNPKDGYIFDYFK